MTAPRIVAQTGPTTWMVESRSRPGEYHTVWSRGGLATCSCPRGVYAKRGELCDHARALLTMLEEGKAPDEVQPEGTPE